MGILHYSLIANFVLLFCLFSPNIVFFIHKKFFIWKNTSEWGYLSPKQYRYSVGTIVILLESGVEYEILENGRYDYLICRTDTRGDLRIVTQSEIKLK